MALKITSDTPMPSDDELAKDRSREIAEHQQEIKARNEKLEKFVEANVNRNEFNHSEFHLRLMAANAGQLADLLLRAETMSNSPTEVGDKEKLVMKMATVVLKEKFINSVGVVLKAHQRYIKAKEKLENKITAEDLHIVPATEDEFNEP